MVTAVDNRSPRGLPQSPALSNTRLGVPFLLLLVWVAFEFGRPPNPLGIPLLTSLALVAAWIMKQDKQWTSLNWWWLFLLGLMVFSVPLATNSFSAYVFTKTMAILFLCICLPLQAFVTTPRHLRVFIWSFLVICTVVGAWAAGHGGFGPSGAAGSQDENYIATLMDMALPFAYFAMLAEPRRAVKILLGLMMVVFVAAIALGQNPSRGGFIGLCVVGVFCVWRSPKKRVGFFVLSVMAVALAVIAGPAFWAEVETSADYSSGTGDVRLEIWLAGLRMWMAHPLFGVGPGNFRWVIGEVQSAEQLMKFGRSLGGSIIAHSFYVELLAELGLAGLLATGVIVTRTWRSLSGVRLALPRSGLSPDQQWVGAGANAVQGGILAVLVNGVFLSLFYYANLWILLALGMTLPFVLRRTMAGPPIASGELGGRTRARTAPARRGPTPPIEPHTKGVGIVEG